MKNGKQYITVEHPNTHNHRDVRLYSDTEWTKLYGKTPSTQELDGRKHFSGLRQARGFANGPILVIRNTLPNDEEWLNRSCARYAVDIGWYIVSTDTLPLDTPSHLALVPLTFEEFTDNDETLMKQEKELTKIINGKLRDKKFLSPKTLLGH